MKETGNISIHTENIFPIIKKFLYSDHEIFLRELVSNAVDASQKIKRLSSIGEFNGELGELKVKVSFDKDKKTITISDNGIGMTAEEIKKYINQIAFSGATEFVEKYKDQGDDKGIIGHFGLGFYSAFMVAKEVEIISKSYQEGSEAASWKCDGSTEYTIGSAKKKTRGTDIILHIAEDSEEFLEEFKLKSILEKYGKFLPIEIEFGDKVINNPNPIWTKSPSDLTDEDYLKFYEELYPFQEKPLFWIHLNVDYPFNLTGILYFPKVKNEMQLQREKISLYSRQVFITDEVKDIVPEFLMLLHGVIDSPDIPLNVSRSFLQADSNVKKINSYITKKVADKLAELFKSDRPAFEEKFANIGLFIKYGMISDEKFLEKAKDFCLVQDTNNKYFTLDEYSEEVQAAQTDKDGNKVYLYTTDVEQQDAFIQSAQNKGYSVIKLDTLIDSHFINTMESKLEKTQWKRVDADAVDKLIDTGITLEAILSDAQKESVKKVFEETLNDKQKVVAVEAMSPDELPAIVTQNEFMRRMSDMSKTGGGGMGMFGAMPNTYNITINANHPLISKLADLKDESEQKALAKQISDLALLSQNLLTGADLTAFIKRTVGGF
ncbi:molecular chaperone HtpG [Aquirufa antheringensis]|jgi:molecular chaperone HtpG|uniref:Chaperone protein HtpG n=1 Tax=Aquirufa antheringensis TaxID=2516559 RepID=A0A4Q9B9J5_9BACT|nr:molecular chaperone HtpG [Aquirufa antheringensis]MCE4216172.1 molecular chaperone HtpG [Pseudarcicella sp. GAP-15]MCZ2485628.1 molecular chaperone HtpG [Aquirufa antheringensis]MCZ2486667.1 molecular chaperone HtpG [Aquirufa antheringensis]MCZ2488552.1 molecular chaperone HtpG [Aquirufa antheringensis]TBH71894.1 molecular chaperone HtpG [Aquirufa antheringensis]